jgi:hypothetical protein
MDRELGWSRAIGVLMIVASAGAVLAMAHHPSGPHGGPLVGIVHSAMIVFLLLWAWGFFVFASKLGAARVTVVGGLIAYSASLLAHLIAAITNGFVAPGLMEAGVENHDLFLLAWLTNQAFAKLGVYLTGAGYSLWSVELLTRGRRDLRLLGGAGLIAGIGPAILLASGLVDMRVAGAFVIYAAHALWAAVVGFFLLRGSLNANS